MNDRNKLISELYKKVSYIVDYHDMEAIATFILARDKKIVEPLIKFNNELKQIKVTMPWLVSAKEAIDETLKNAGVEVG